MMSLAEYRSSSTHLADFLPWAALVAPGVVLNKDGSFQRTASFRGPDLESAVAAELVAAASRLNSALCAYAVPDLKLLGEVPLGGKGAGWLVITPDDKTAYVANEHTNNVSVVDIKSLKEIAVIPVGFAPARNRYSTAMM